MSEKSEMLNAMCEFSKIKESRLKPAKFSNVLDYLNKFNFHVSSRFFPMNNEGCAYLHFRTMRVEIKIFVRY